MQISKPWKALSSWAWLHLSVDNPSALWSATVISRRKRETKSIEPLQVRESEAWHLSNNEHCPGNANDCSSFSIQPHWSTLVLSPINIKPEIGPSSLVIHSILFVLNFIRVACLKRFLHVIRWNGWQMTVRVCEMSIALLRGRRHI